MGALPWQRYFNSSDYAWYNLEEGRYTGVSANWHINKRLDWYNGIEFGGWGVVLRKLSAAPQYITNVSYWLDEEAKKTKVWTTVLTGPTGVARQRQHAPMFELRHCSTTGTSTCYQIIDTQMVYSKAPIFCDRPPGLQRTGLRRLHLPRRPPEPVLGHQQPARVVPATWTAAAIRVASASRTPNYYEMTVGLGLPPDQVAADPPRDSLRPGDEPRLRPELQPSRTSSASPRTC